MQTILFFWSIVFHNMKIFVYSWTIYKSPPSRRNSNRELNRSIECQADNEPDHVVAID